MRLVLVVMVTSLSDSFVLGRDGMVLGNGVDFHEVVNVWVFSLCCAHVYALCPGLTV
jgi:hypothetical protein